MNVFVDSSETFDFSVDAAEVVSGRVPESDENIITCYARMNFKAKARVDKELMEMRIEAGKSRSGNSATFQFSLTSQKLVYLKHNIKKWRGPAFQREDGRPVPSTPAMIETLDPTLEWIDALFEELRTRNTRPGESDNPKD